MAPPRLGTTSHRSKRGWLHRSCKSKQRAAAKHQRPHLPLRQDTRAAGGVAGGKPGLHENQETRVAAAAQSITIAENQEPSFCETLTIHTDHFYPYS